MNALLDTSVLVAAFYGDHPHHTPSIALLSRLSPDVGACAAHSLAEVYSTLTGMPPPHRVGGHEAQLFLHDVRAHLTPIELRAADYADCVELAAGAGFKGGIIYDVLIGRCAYLAKAQTLYTWNLRHFERVLHGSSISVRTP